MARRINKKRYYSKKIQKENAEAIGLGGIVLIIFCGGYYIYQELIQLDIKIVIFFISLIIIFITLIIIYVHKKKKQKEREKLEKFPIFIRELTNKISNFRPLKHYTKEENFQIELAGYLKNHYNNLNIEIQKDYSRPDIVIENVAIEIKGPTTMQGLKTIPDKINSYLPKWDFLIIVLFDIKIADISEENIRIYNEKKREICENIIDSKRDKVIFIEI